MSTSASRPRSSTSHPSSSTTTSHPPTSHRKRSPSLPKLNLDDCSPFLATTTTNTSTNAASRPSTAFVFTSSRTIQNLHNYRSPRSDADLLPPVEINAPSQPAGSPAAIELSRPKERKKPVLSQEQLARHSRGALDARCIVSSKMRAAGFIPLTYSPSSDHSALSTPMVPSVPTPKDPPRFPPVVFVNPSDLTSVSLWDYQRSLPYGLGQGNVTGLGLTPEEAKHKTPAGSTSEPSSIPFSHNISNTSVMTSSHFSTISRPSFGLTSAPSPNSQSTSRLHSPVPERASKSSHKERGVKPDVDGYPFPRTPTSSVATSLRSTKPHQTVPYPVQATASPAISWTSTSGSVTPLAQSPQSPPPLREESPLVSSAHVGRPSIKPVQSKSTKTVKQMDHQRRQEDRQTARESISLTELCSSSPFAWSAGLVFPPPSSITGSSLSSGSLVNSSSNSSGRRSSAALSRGSGSSSVGAVNSPRSEGVDVAAVDEALEAEATQQEQSSGMLSPVAEAENATTGEDAKSDDIKIEKSSHRRLQRGRDLERERRREQRKLERKMTEADLNAADGALTESVSSGVSSPGSERGRGGKTRRSPKLKKVKGKSDNEPIASVAASSVFLPKETNSALGRAHLLGDSRERKREAAEIAKDQVLAHRERDREHARLTEQWSLSDDDSRLSSQKHASKAVAFTDVASIYSTSSTFEHGGRGRGRGHGERPSTRDHSINSAVSVLSDAETMVGDAQTYASQVETTDEG